jgi:hypothetical protein
VEGAEAYGPALLCEANVTMTRARSLQRCSAASRTSQPGLPPSFALQHYRAIVLQRCPVYAFESNRAPPSRQHSAGRFDRRRMYFVIVSNLLYRSYRWIACPGASLAAADVANPAIKECSAKTRPALRPDPD